MPFHGLGELLAVTYRCSTNVSDISRVRFRIVLQAPMIPSSRISIYINSQVDVGYSLYDKTTSRWLYE